MDSCMDYPQSFKPLRNKFRLLDVNKSIISLWKFSCHGVGGRGLAGNQLYKTIDGVCVQPRFLVHPWDLEVLLKNIVIYGSEGADCYIDGFEELWKLKSLVSKYQDTLSEHVDHNDIFANLYVLIFQQWYWDAGSSCRAQWRFYELCADKDVSRFFEEKFSCSVLIFYVLANYLHARLCESPLLSFPLNLSEIGIDCEVFKRILEVTVIDVAEYAKLLRRVQRFDKSWFYTGNELRKKPVLRLQGGDLLCPFPSFFLRRLTDGLYFDLINIKKCDLALGKAFESHAFRVAHKFLSDFNCVTGEVPYRAKGNDKHGFDLKIMNQTSCVFVECKIAKANINDLSRVELGSGFVKIVNAVVQAYKNYLDVVSGFTEIDLNSRDVILLVVTLENWYSEMPMVAEWLDSEVRSVLASSGFDMSILDCVKYFVVACEDFEKICYVSSQVGLSGIFDQLNSDEKKGVYSVLHGGYASLLKDVPWNEIFRIKDHVADYGARFKC